MIKITLAAILIWAMFIGTLTYYGFNPMDETSQLQILRTMP
jgi:hypothetical protein